MIYKVLNPYSFVLLAYIHPKKVRLDHDMTAKLVIWDTTGLKKSHKQEHGTIVVYDITQRLSFEEAKKLVDEFAQLARSGVFITLVGTKADLESGREVSFKVSNMAMFI